ncbi:uncharacterized protein LOC130356268 [Hyla sarda]|uniref:uncharacterized protein LOC130356268 n=1 Tax=Hyla sarda TaxID=327740 RepID=UPI0024C211BA|nr:uncharacterized protein LOC130356268 [Hyla sarda]XP_056413514.1 uncharacterized protein LOC130356268 [Hyla sarda]XP_056413521.1 uncharacterized protein LOC130356268 [Hyla sarda]
MPACMVKGCPSGGRHHEEGVTLHVFPKNKEMIKCWLAQTGQNFGDLDEFAEKVLEGKKSDKYRMCSKHFTPGSYIVAEGWRKALRKDAIPTIFDIIPSPALPAFQKRPFKRQRLEESVTPMLMTVYEDPGPSSDFCYHCGQRILANTTMRSIGVLTDFYVGRRDCFTQTDPKMGCKNVATETKLKKYHKRVQCRIRVKPTNSDSSPIPLENSVDEGSHVLQYVVPSDDHETQISDAGCEQSDESEPENVDSPSPNVYQFTPETPLPMHLSTTSPMDIDSTNFSRRHTFDSTLHVSTDTEKTFNYDPDFSEVTLVSDCSNHNDPVKEHKFMVFESCLDALIYKVPCQYQGRCWKPISSIEKKSIGSFVSVYVTCVDSHCYCLWESQPKIGHMPVGNLLLSSAILCSGSSFVKTQHLFSLLGLLNINKLVYFKNRVQYLFPAINHQWQKEQRRNFQIQAANPVCLAGDSKYYLPGDSTKYCVYTMMDVESKKIIGFHVERVRAGMPSFALEKIACKKVLWNLLDQKLHVKMVCTGQHGSVRKMIREEFPNIIHQIDARHLVKSVGHKVARASRKKNCSELCAWVSPIKSHLWWCASTCEEKPEVLVQKWNSLLYHVVNTHSWQAGRGYEHCQHDHIPEAVCKCRKWLSKGGKAYASLKTIVLNKKLQQDLRHVSNFCNSAELEVYHGAMSKFRPKSDPFFIEDLVARTQLAMLDHNNNVYRVQAVVRHATKICDPLFTPRFYNVGNSARKQCFQRALYEAGNHEFLFAIMREVIEFASGNHRQDFPVMIRT